MEKEFIGPVKTTSETRSYIANIPLSQYPVTYKDVFLCDPVMAGESCFLFSQAESVINKFSWAKREVGEVLADYAAGEVDIVEALQYLRDVEVFYKQEEVVE